MRIAVCDDEKAHRTELKAAITESKALPDGIEIAEFPGGEELLKAHAENPFGIIFLDVEMKGMSGLETGHAIRSKDRDVIIIYLSGYEQYVFTSFDVEPFSYVLKPPESIKIGKVLERALRKYTDLRKIVEVKWQDQTHVLRVSEIVYLESDLRHINFYTKNNTFKSVGKLSLYERNLSPYGFLRCHQSFLVNMKFIKNIGSTAIRVITDAEEVKGELQIDMSSRRKQYCLNAFNDYLAKYRV
ncbi:MAG: LytTR family DNA-binding domain-containing protein [Oscillospiraceae bacterium]|nr:LytTR family DNA-binding domain-containing protein [Oscillospiraceae bacterium]